MKTPPIPSVGCGDCSARLPQRITVTLTRKQASALLSAAGQILGHEDAIAATFVDRRDWKHAAIAHDKIQSALHPSPNIGSQRTRPAVSENQTAEAHTTEPRPGSL